MIAKRVTTWWECERKKNLKDWKRRLFLLMFFMQKKWAHQKEDIHREWKPGRAFKSSKDCSHRRFKIKHCRRFILKPWKIVAKRTKKILKIIFHNHSIIPLWKVNQLYKEELRIMKKKALICVLNFVISHKLMRNQVIQFFFFFS
jgi:hypothetical protein